MKSLEEKIVDEELELKDKKIIALNLTEPYPMGYIIVETGEFLAFTDYGDGDMSFLNARDVYRNLYYNDKLLKIFLEHGCISQEDHDNLLKNKEEEQIKRREAENQRQYKKYLELKAIYDKE